jgi:hypothetical protein
MRPFRERFLGGGTRGAGRELTLGFLSGEPTDRQALHTIAETKGMATTSTTYPAPRVGLSYALEIRY